MQGNNWWPILASLIGGGAFGAFLTHMFTLRRDRIPAIGKKITLKPFFNSKQHEKFDTKVVFTGKTKEYKFDIVYTANIKLKNTSRKNFDEFSFGLTLPENIKIIKLIKNSKDRHHSITPASEPDPENQLNQIDISLKPLNRKDEYEIDLVITSDISEKITTILNRDINISTSLPVKFVDMSYDGELKIEPILKQSFFGIFEISYHKSK